MASGWSPRKYERVIKGLNSQDDILRISEKTGIDPEVLRIIFLQKEVRRMIKLHGKILKKRSELLEMWKSGMSIVEIAEKERFSPILLVHILLPAMEISKKKTKKMVKNPEIADDERLEKEIREAMAIDYLYSPRAHDEQRRRGLEGESRLFEWLDSKGIEYIKEDDMEKGEGVKTPDALLKSPIKLFGREIIWFDSKSLFGDPEEIKRAYERQFKHYLEVFGPGAVIYWYGFVEYEDMPREILILDSSFLEKI